MTFEEVLNRLSPEIDGIVRSGSQRIPGYDRDDIRSELLLCLWKARLTYKRGLGIPFEAYWWSVWLHRKADIIRTVLRKKRDFRKEELTDEVPDAGYDPFEFVLPPPPNAGETEQKVWSLVAVGATQREITTLCRINTKKYKEIINSWKNEEVKGMLTC